MSAHGSDQTGRGALVTALINRLDNLYRPADWPEVAALRDRVVALIADAEAETARLESQVAILARVNGDLHAMVVELRKQNAELRERWSGEVAKQIQKEV